MRGGGDDRLPHLVFARDSLHVEVATVAGAAQVGDEAPHNGRGDCPLEGENLGDDAPVLRFEPIGEPARGDVKHAVAVSESRKIQLQ